MSIYVFLIDQVLKWKLHDTSHQIIPGFMEIIGEKNYGIAFSLPIPVLMSIIVTFILIFGMIYFVKKSFDLRNKWSVVLVGLVLGGAAGNLFDRILHGYVIDYLSIWKWPVFNFADLCIVVGAVTIAIKFDILLHEKK